ncbi:hypothetical protein EG329_000519 [Mollisiaceae sp. DMI_Dod_QoI]|nr:hypothetical protein EG329_000519 [Helotiales sp. DMI_Dod_QoI]
MDLSDQYTTHNSSLEMSDDDGDDAQWDDDDLDTVMQTAATPAGLSTSTAIYSGNHALSTASSSSSSSLGPVNSASKRKKAQGLRKVSKSSGGKKKEFTSKMQDRQARGKDVLSSDDDSSDNVFNPRFNPYENADAWESRQRRRLAAVILDNPELLMMHAQERSDSIPGTRHHFTKILCGYQEAENEYPFTKSFEEEKARKSRRKYQGSRNSRIESAGSQHQGGEGLAGPN